MKIDIDYARILIQYGQRLLEKDKNHIEQVVSDLSGIQYDPNPILHLNHYLVLWSRIPGFKVIDYDRLAYQEGKLVEANLFKRNLFIVPSSEIEMYNAATKRIVRWGRSREQDEYELNSMPEEAEVERIRQAFKKIHAGTLNELWEYLGVTEEWNAYREGRKQGQLNNYSPVFRTFFSMRMTNQIIISNRLPGTFRQPVFSLREDIQANTVELHASCGTEAMEFSLFKLICSFGITDAVHMKAITGFGKEEINAALSSLLTKEQIMEIKVEGMKKTYVAAKKQIDSLERQKLGGKNEVTLLSPMEGIIRDKRWLNTFFDYSFHFEYFKKKGMKWPLSILSNNEMVGFVDCSMDRKRKRMQVKEINLQKEQMVDMDLLFDSLCSLARLHDADELFITGEKYIKYS